MEVILVNTGTKFDEWYVDHMQWQLKQVAMDYPVHVIREERYEGVWNKLLMFEQFKEGPYLYLDLDLILLKNIDHLIRDDLTLLHAWWREKLHTPLNSSIMSWKGDYSFYHNIFAENPEYYMLKYPGIDQYIYELDMPYNTYEPCCTSFRYHGFDTKWPVVLFNQRYEEVKTWTKYLQ